MFWWFLSKIFFGLNNFSNGWLGLSGLICHDSLCTRESYPIKFSLETFQVKKRVRTPIRVITVEVTNFYGSLPARWTRVSFSFREGNPSRNGLLCLRTFLYFLFSANKLFTRFPYLYPCSEGLSSCQKRGVFLEHIVKNRWQWVSRPWTMIFTDHRHSKRWFYYIHQLKSMRDLSWGHTESSTFEIITVSFFSSSLHVSYHSAKRFTLLVPLYKRCTYLP